MMRFRASENLKLGFVASIVLIGINLWSFQVIGEVFFKALELLAGLTMLVIVASNTSILFKRGVKFKVEVLLFLLLPLLSLIGAYAFHDQPVHLSLLFYRINLFWLFYFVLHIFNISSEKIIKLMIFIGCGWALLTVIQQFTYPIIFFYTRSEDIRGNVVRIMPSGQHFGVFVLLYFFYSFLVSKKETALPFIALGLAGVYFYGSRQTLGMAIVSMLVGVLLLKGLAKWKYLISAVFAALFVVVVMQPSMISEYMELTNRQVSDEDYIRFQAIDFYLNQYWPHWWAKLLGNGQAHEQAAYGVEMYYITKVLGFHRSDIGIIGVYNAYGVFYILNIIFVCVRAFFMKMPLAKDKYLKLPIFYTAILLPLSVSFSTGSGMCFYALLFFLIDKSLEKESGTSFHAVSGRKKLVTAQFLH